jgi:hypothetical protein
LGSGGCELGSGGRDEDCVVDTEEVTGDQGREDAIDVREKLRLKTPPIVDDISLYVPVADGDRLGGVPLIVVLRSSWTLVELFQIGFDDPVRALASTLPPCGEESGVTLWL